jgi:hypothetical protein
MNTCCNCLEREPGYHSKTLCGLCFVQSLVDDKRDEEAFEAAVVEGIEAGVVKTMISVAEERAQQAFRDKQTKLLRLALPSNDDASARPCRTPPPPVGDVAAIAMPMAARVPGHVWSPERVTVRPGRVEGPPPVAGHVNGLPYWICEYDPENS